jgi:hypothetical protein
MSANCLPGNPCYDAYYHPPGTQGCGPCIVTSTNIVYVGPNLPNSGVNNNDRLNTVLQKIDNAISPENLAIALIDAIASNPTLAVQFCTLVSNCGTITTTTTTSHTTTTTTTAVPAANTVYMKFGVL